MFEGLTEEELASIYKLCLNVAFSEGQTIIKEDQPGDKIFILVEGQVEIIVDNPLNKGEKIRLAKLSMHETFGEFSLFDDAPRSATAIAQTNARLLEIPCKELLLLFDENNRLGIKLMKNLGKILCTRLRNIDIEYRNAQLWVGV